MACRWHVVSIKVGSTQTATAFEIYFLLKATKNIKVKIDPPRSIK